MLNKNGFTAKKQAETDSHTYCNQPNGPNESIVTL